VSLDLYKLEHLVAVAEEGSITRAAARLHLSQQALSTSVRTLEREVGVPLLDRSGIAVTLLPAGQALVEDARVLHGVAGAALRRARRIGRGQAEELRVGHTPAITGEEVIGLLKPVTDARPGLVVEVHQRYPAEMSAALLAGDIDVGLCRGMTPAPGLERHTLGHQRLRIAVDTDHPLAPRASIALPDLAGERFLVWGEPGRSGYTDLLIEHCRQAGFEPHVERTTRQGTPPVTAVLGTDRLAFVTAPAGPTAGGRVQIVEVEPPVHAPLHALYLPQTEHSSRDALLTEADV
jgi:DNA-binding transcriptional LysR family regulator